MNVFLENQYFELNVQSGLFLTFQSKFQTYKKFYFKLFFVNCKWNEYGFLSSKAGHSLLKINIASPSCQTIQLAMDLTDKTD
jgi:hypothetical protein